MEPDAFQGKPDSAFAWFTQFQIHAVIRNGVIPEWFHGIISRKAAEELLLPKPTGYFLIRVSESRIGYTLSYRADDRCRHFMIDALKDGYVIVGETTKHRFLQDLVNFHRKTPIRPFSELLTVPCGQMSEDKADYAELLFPKRRLSKNSFGPLPNNSQHSNSSHLTAPEDTPPALPLRPTTLGNYAVPATRTRSVPIVSPTRLYPCLDDVESHVNFQASVRVGEPKPVPLPRKTFLTVSQPEQPPDLPARCLLPTQSKDQTSTDTVSAQESHSIFKSSRNPERIIAEPNIQGGLQSQDGILQSAGSQGVMYLANNTNLVHSKKTYQTNSSMSEEHFYSEINMESEGRLAFLEARDRNRARQTNSYQELQEKQTVDGPPFPTHLSAAGVMNSGFPVEYLPPPPFAPGY